MRVRCLLILHPAWKSGLMFLQPTSIELALNHGMNHDAEQASICGSAKHASTDVWCVACRVWERPSPD